VPDRLAGHSRRPWRERYRVLVIRECSVTETAALHRVRRDETWGSRHYYSVPHRLLHEPVDVRSSATTVEVFHHGVRVASHRRSDERAATRPSTSISPRRISSTWSGRASRVLGWAERVGAHTRDLARDDPRRAAAPRTGLPLVPRARALERRYGAARVDAILKHGLDRVPLSTQLTPALPEAEAHEHVRGPAYYHTMSGENTMLISPTLEKLRAMKSGAMANAWAAH
jgi:hypothetical protein